MLLAATCQAQQIHLWQNRKGVAVAANADRLWQYNRYEHSRWGLGLTATYAPPDKSRTTHQVDAWGGWGVEDKQLKGGLCYSLHTKRSANTTDISLAIADDVFPSGGLTLATHAEGFNAVVSNLGRSLMTHQQKAEAALAIKHARTTYGLSATLFSEQRLYDSIGLLYGQGARHYRGLDLTATVAWPQGLEATIALTLADHAATTAIKGLLQYHKQLQRRLLTTRIAAHAGACSPNVWQHRRFCLGGSNGMLLASDQAMATVWPDEFWADAFALCMVRVQTTSPLFSLYNANVMIGLVPTPFATLKAMWGTLWNATPGGHIVDDGIDMQAPYNGLIEVGMGIDGLLRWGFSDWGVGVAMRLAPRSASYFKAELSANMAFTLSARLWL